MNIISTNLYTQNIYKPVFGAQKAPKNQQISIPKTQTSDTFEKALEQESLLPKKMELTETEKSFNEVLIKYYKLEANAKTQRNNLYDYYSAQDKYDYQELLKEKRRVKSKLDKMAKQFGTTTFDLSYDILDKKDYNWFAPKIFRSKTVQELMQWQTELDNTILHLKVRKLLNKLIEQKLNLIKK